MERMMNWVVWPSAGARFGYATSVRGERRGHGVR